MPTPSGDEPLRAALRSLTVALAAVGAPHMLIGGMAVMLRGVARQTNDIDATIWAEGIDIEALLDTLAGHGIVGRRSDTAEFARQHQVLLLRHAASDTPMELSLAWLPFERTALQRSERIDVGGDVMPVAQPEDLVVYKAVAWRDRDRADIERLVIAHRDRIDLARVRALVSQFAELLDEPERVADLDRLLERVRRPVDD